MAASVVQRYPDPDGPVAGRAPDTVRQPACDEDWAGYSLGRGAVVVLGAARVHGAAWLLAPQPCRGLGAIEVIGARSSSPGADIVRFRTG